MAWCARKPDGLWRLGDQAAVIPSFAGEGMSIALHSARRAAQGLIAGASGAAFQAGLAADLRGQVRLATALSRMMVRPGVQRLAPLVAPALVPWLGPATRLKPRDAPPPAIAGPDRPLGHPMLRS